MDWKILKHALAEFGIYEQTKQKPPWTVVSQRNCTTNLPDTRDIEKFYATGFSEVNQENFKKNLEGRSKI